MSLDERLQKDCQANQEPGLNLDCLILKMTTLTSFETTRPTTQRHIPEHLHLRFFFCNFSDMVNTYEKDEINHEWRCNSSS